MATYHVVLARGPHRTTIDARDITARTPADAAVSMLQDHQLDGRRWAWAWGRDSVTGRSGRAQVTATRTDPTEGTDDITPF